MPLVPFPRRGDILLDARGGDRALRVAHHVAEGFVVLSVWRGRTCVATTRLSPADAERLAEVLRATAADAAQARAAT
jgi:hypothetical protein